MRAKPWLTNDVMDVDSFRKITEQLASEFSNLHTSHAHLLASIEGLQHSPGALRESSKNAVGSSPEQVTTLNVPDSEVDEVLDEELCVVPSEMRRLSYMSDQGVTEVVQQTACDVEETAGGCSLLQRGHSQSRRRPSLDNSDVKDLAAIFHKLDTEGNGSLDACRLRMALVAVGVPPARLGKVFQLADKDDSGTIELEEWLEAITSDDMEMQQLATSLRQLSHNGHIDFVELLALKGQNNWMLQPLAWPRALWDTVMTVVCISIAVFLPFNAAWSGVLSSETNERFRSFDRAINWLFIIDIFMNFRTGYMDRQNKPVLDWKLVAKNYLKTWFLFDLVSSLPTDEIPESASARMQGADILRLGKLLKMLRIMRHRSIDVAALSDTLDDLIQMKLVQLILRKSRIFCYMLLLCHWMACGMKTVDADTGWLSQYRNIQGKLWSEYLSALYWAMTTLTTVGYGDLIPTTDAERAYSTASMVVASGFYGYVVGAITSVVSKSDLNATAYQERMDLIYAWLNHHQLPIHMKRSLRRYFKSYLAEKSAISEAQVFQDLSHELQMEVGEYLIHEDVKNNPLLDGIGIGAVVQLQSILKMVTIEAGFSVVSAGEVGTSMHILVSGRMEMVREVKEDSAAPVSWASERGRALHRSSSKSSLEEGAFMAKQTSSPSDSGTTLEKRKSTTTDASPKLKRTMTNTGIGGGRWIVPGQSFGEEILLGFVEHYEYTVNATEKCKIIMIAQVEFLTVFNMMPNVLERMRRNALSSSPEWATRLKSSPKVSGKSPSKTRSDSPHSQNTDRAMRPSGSDGGETRLTVPTTLQLPTRKSV